MSNNAKNNFFGNNKLIALFIVLLSIFLLQLIYNDFASSKSLLSFNPENFWFLRLLGRLHPLAVHFPVALLLFTALLELGTIKNFNSTLRPGIKILLIAGIISSLISAIFGILLSGSAEYGENLILHQWLGISTAFSGILVWFLHQRILIKNQTQYIKTYRLALFITALGVIIAGHLGASLTHGDDYLSSTLPWTDNFENTETTSFDINSNNHDQDTLTKAQEKELNLKVRAIFAHNCYKCHGDEKVKGDLRLDSKDFVFKGGENGEVIVPGKPEESELFRRISLPSNHEDVMPSKGKKLTANDLAIIEFWIKKGAPWPDGSDKDGVFKVAELAPRNPVLPSASGIYTNPVDRWTNQYFVENKITWPKLVDDRTFLRRLYMDVIGLLPNKQETDEFKKDKRPDKRAIWSKKLLDREDDYALHWLTFWNDALRNDYTGTGYITNGRYAITDWLYQSIKSNKSYDLFVKELVNPDENSKGFIEGIKWRGVVNSSQRTEMQAAQNVAQVFLGLNLKCASCHNSFISDWKLEDAYAFANIFADTTLEINRCDKPTGKFTDARMLWKELGSIDNNASVPVKRSQLANNMVKPQNGRLYRTLVNRIWAQIMGRGFIEPVDLMDNDPWSEDMLDWMAFNFQQNNSNIKDLIYLITSSKTYQLPSAGFKDPNEIVSQEYKFSGRLRKRMSAEQFADAGSALFGPLFPDSMVRYKPVIKNLKDQNIQLFARASQVVNNPFLTALGRPNRETVSTSRESQANLLQALELTNGERFNSTLKKGAEIWTTKYKSGDQIIKEIYRQALGREVRSDEYKIAIKILGDKPQADTVQDLFWAIMLLPEFQIIY
jgi:uncharacterized membrane protein/mono/diheme cytochrome c family protein